MGKHLVTQSYAALSQSMKSLNDELGQTNHAMARPSTLDQSQSRS